MNNEYLRELYFGYATQYYVVGRYAAISSVTPVAGNLLHHAVEIALKGHLANSMSSSELKDNFKHNLSKLWGAFKNTLPTSDLEKYDTVISRLDQFETIRYPDHTSEFGMLVLHNVTKVLNRSKPKLPSPVPRYDLRLQEVDTLFDEIFNASSVNPKFFMSGLSKEAKNYLSEENATRWSG